MKNKTLHKLLTLIVLATLAFSWQAKDAPISEAAFGISPPWVRNLHALPGTSFEQTITLSTNNASQDMKVSANVRGDRNLINWVTIKDMDSLILHSGETQLPMIVQVNIPKRAGLKEYKGSIDIRLEPVKASESSGVSIALGANASIEITVVGDAFSDFKINSIATQPIQAGQPIRLELQVENRGNIDIDKIRTEVDVWNETETVKLQTYNGELLVTPVDPYETQKTIVEIPTPNLTPGKYWLKVKAFKDQVAIFETKLYLAVEDLPKLESAEKPKLPEAPVVPAIEEATPEAVTAPALTTPAAEEVRPAAPAQDNSKLFMMIAFGALGIALIAVIGMITFMILFLKKQSPK